MEHASRLWSYLSSTRAHAPCDAIVVCCSYDLRVCDYACEMLKAGTAPRLVLTGKTGNWTKHLWSLPEAHVFRDRELTNGVEAGQICIEDQATNFGENIAFVRRQLPELRRATFVTKPNSVLRVALTVPVHWPEIAASIDAPAFDFPNDVSNVIGVFGVIHEMVGDVDRILHYPARGFQVPHRLLEPVLESWNKLVKEGFDRHLLG
jgi:uncharacterized SAM-binding protein YcdF (DUF218 family)